MRQKIERGQRVEDVMVCVTRSEFLVLSGVGLPFETVRQKKVHKSKSPFYIFLRAFEITEYNLIIYSLIQIKKDLINFYNLNFFNVIKLRDNSLKGINVINICKINIFFNTKKGIKIYIFGQKYHVWV